MASFTDLTGLASVAFAVAATIALLPKIARLSMVRLAVLQCAVLLLLLIPFSGFPLAAYLRGGTGDLSITTLVLLGCAMFTSWFGCGFDDTMNRRALLMPIALAALLLYPLALGVGSYDPYRLGYGDPWFVFALLLVALAAWIVKYHLLALAVACAVLAWTAGWYESGNLWDYLLDPWLAIYALFVYTKHGIRLFMLRGKVDGLRV